MVTHAGIGNNDWPVAASSAAISMFGHRLLRRQRR